MNTPKRRILSLVFTVFKWFEPRNYILLGKTGLWWWLPLRMLKRQSPPKVLFGTPFTRRSNFVAVWKLFAKLKIISSPSRPRCTMIYWNKQNVLEEKTNYRLYNSLQATWRNCIILQVHRPFPVWLHRQAMPWTVVDQWKKNFWRKLKSWAMRCLLTLWINSSMIWEDQIMLPR